MKPMRITLAPAVGVDDLVAESQTPAAGGVQALTLATTELDVARPLLLTTAADETLITFTFTGTDRYGNVIVDTVAGVNNDTVETPKSFKTVESITVSGNTTGAIIVGTSDTIWTPWLMLDHWADGLVTIEGRVLGDSPDFTFDIYSTLDDLQVPDFQEEFAVRDVITDLASKTATTKATLNEMAMGVRARISSFAAGYLELVVLQEKA